MSAEIQELQVHDGFIVARLASATEIMLDGWRRWRPLSDFSWYDPWLVLGTVEKPLSPGSRTLSVRDGSGNVASADFTIPGASWRTIWRATEITDKGEFRRVVDAGEAINVAPGRFRFRVAAPVGSGSHHCEAQQQGLSPRGIEIAYDWSCTIKPGSVFPTAPHSTTIHQSHADNQTGYGGGILAYNDGRLRLHIRGGKVTNPKGSIHREYEKDFYLDPFRFKIGEPFHIRREVKWDAVHGYSRCFINGEKLHEALDVPTFPAERAEGSMFRVGFYPGDGEVAPLLDMDVEGLKFEVPA